MNGIELLSTLHVNDQSPGGSVVVSPLMAALNVASGRDYIEGHYDSDAAKALGHRDIYMSTYFHHGLLDRAVTDWLGPEAFIIRRKAKTMASIYVGDTVHWNVKVTGIDCGACLVTCAIELSTQQGICCVAETTAQLYAFKDLRWPVPQPSERSLSH